MLIIDGCMGEGGGQILRSALALALCRQRPFRIVNIRARRPRPGLRPQHLAAVRAAAAICGAVVEGAEPGAQTLSFEPGELRPGEYRFRIGTAGSTSLLLQTILPALLTANGPSLLELEGGTHNPRAPSFDCLARAYLPLVERMGPHIAIELERYGFEPAGGGRVRVRIDPVRRLRPLVLEERGACLGIEGEVLLSRLPRHIAEREIAVLAAALPLDESRIALRSVTDSPGPGNVASLFVTCEHITEVFAGFGRRGVPAERVATGVADAVRRYLKSGAAVGVHLADQLLLPLALAGVGSFSTLPPSRHTRTNIQVISEFLPVDIDCREPDESGKWRISIAARR